MAAPRVVATLVDIGPFFSTDSAPDINFILLWNTGGYVDLTGASVTAYVRRWEPRTQRPLGPVLTEAPCAVGVATRGDCTFVWAEADPLDAVPADPGWYVAYVVVSFPDGTTQRSQRAVFEVMT